MQDYITVFAILVNLPLSLVLFVIPILAIIFG